jgi:hypothetical protein
MAFLRFLRPPHSARARALLCGAGMALVVLIPAARAQLADRYMLDLYFPTGIPGYGTEPGTTVLSRARPFYEPLGVRVGDFIIRPEVDESLGYNNNVTGLSPAQGSFIAATTASVGFASDWTRNSLGGAVSVTNTQVPGVQGQTTTNWSVALGGTYQISNDVLTLAGSYLSLTQPTTALQSTQFNVPGFLYTAPVPYTMGDLRAAYTANFGRISLTPAFDYSQLRFSNLQLFGVNGFVPPPPVGGFVLGIPVQQDYRNRNLYDASITGRYEFAPQRDLVVVIRNVYADYISPNANLFGPNRSSNAIQALVGLDYTASAVWRYRVLVGVETRMFQNSAYPNHTAPITEIDVIWQPTGLTTVTLRALRTIEDAADENVAGYDFNSARLQVDHELRRNILLTGYVGLQHVNYIGVDATQTFYGGGVGLTYLVNRHVRVAVTDDVVSLTGAQAFGPNYTQNIALVTLKLAM